MGRVRERVLALLTRNVCRLGYHSWQVNRQAETLEEIVVVLRCRRCGAERTERLLRPIRRVVL